MEEGKWLKNKVGARETVKKKVPSLEEEEKRAKKIGEFGNVTFCSCNSLNKGKVIFEFITMLNQIFFSVQMLDDQDVTLPANMEECRGTASAFDLHVDELSDGEVHILTSPVPVLR